MPPPAVAEEPLRLAHRAQADVVDLDAPRPPVASARRRAGRGCRRRGRRRRRSGRGPPRRPRSSSLSPPGRAGRYVAVRRPPAAPHAFGDDPVGQPAPAAVQRGDGALGDQHHRHAVGGEHECRGVSSAVACPSSSARGRVAPGGSVRRTRRAVHLLAERKRSHGKPMAAASRSRLASTLAASSSVSRPRLSESNGPGRRRRGGWRTARGRRAARRRCGPRPKRNGAGSCGHARPRGRAPGPGRICTIDVVVCP